MSSTPETTGNGVRVPVQTRSRATYAKLLDAADQLVLEHGPNGLAATKVAEQAGVAAGTMYQFFANVPALLDALAQRYVDAFEPMRQQVMTASLTATWAEHAEAVIDAYAGYYRAHPTFRRVWFERPAEERAALDESTNTQMSDDLSALVRLRFGIDRARSSAVARTAVVIGDSMLAAAFQQAPNGDELLLTEAKRALQGYLEAAERALANSAAETSGGAAGPAGGVEDPAA